MPVEDRHREKTDTAIGTALATGKVIKKRGFGSFKPVSGLSKERTGRIKGRL
jgi:hypothetical protein